MSEEEFRSKFTRFGRIEQCRLVRKETRSFGFVHFGSPEAAEQAIRELDNTQPFDSKFTLRVQFDKNEQTRPRRAYPDAGPPTDDGASKRRRQDDDYAGSRHVDNGMSPLLMDSQQHDARNDINSVAEFNRGLRREDVRESREERSDAVDTRPRNPRTNVLFIRGFNPATSGLFILFIRSLIENQTRT